MTGKYDRLGNHLVGPGAAMIIPTVAAVETAASHTGVTTGP